MELKDKRQQRRIEGANPNMEQSKKKEKSELRPKPKNKWASDVVEEDGIADKPFVKPESAVRESRQIIENHFIFFSVVWPHQCK